MQFVLLAHWLTDCKTGLGTLETLRLISKTESSG